MIKSSLRCALSLAILVLSPGLASYAAAAETVSLRLPERIAVAPVVDPASKLSVQTAPAGLEPTAQLGALPTIEAGLPAASVVVNPATPDAAPLPLAAPSAELQAAAPGALTPVAALGNAAPLAAAAGPEASGWKWSALFDRVLKRGALSDAAAPVAGRSSSAAAPLAKASPSAKTAAEVPQPARRAGGSTLRRLAPALVALALLLAVPTLALAAPAAAAAAPAVTGLSMLTSYHPLFTAGAAAAGAVYGLVAAHKKEGKAPSLAEAASSVLRYGILAGAATYVLLDLTQGLFLGFGSALKPLPTAMATAALGQSAFQGKFADADTSGADRIMGVFPAVAAALGLSVGAFALTALSAPLALASSAMVVTGVASAAYAAIFKPGVSNPAGPAAMARGYVLQSLMAGLALAVPQTDVALTFGLLAAMGFWQVLSTTLRELWAQARAKDKSFRS